MIYHIVKYYNLIKQYKNESHSCLGTTSGCWTRLAGTSVTLTIMVYTLEIETTFFFIFFISSFQKPQNIKELTISKKLSVCRCQQCPTFQDLTKYLRPQSLLITILFGHTVLCKIDISTLISDIFAEEGRRTLYKAYGIKFVIIVQGIAGAELRF